MSKGYPMKMNVKVFLKDH